MWLVRNYILYVSVCYVFTRLIIWAARASSFFSDSLARARNADKKSIRLTFIFIIRRHCSWGKMCETSICTAALMRRPFQFST